MTPMFECDKCGARFDDGIDAGSHDCADALVSAIQRLEEQRQTYAQEAVANGSQWEDRGQGVVAGIDLSLSILREGRA